jgi:hypothetical protein
MPYVYKLVDTITDKWYIGSRTSKSCNPEELGNKYFTSSSEVSALFKADPLRFEKKILVVGDADYIARTEVSFLHFYDAMNDALSYNKTNGNQNYASHKVGARIAALKIGVCGRSMQEKVEHGRKGARISRERQVGIFAPGMAAKAGRLAAGKGGKIGGKISGTAQALAGVGIHTFASRSNAGKVGGVVTGALRYKCLACGEISSPGPLGMHQKAAGHTGKERLYAA